MPRSLMGTEGNPLRQTCRQGAMKQREMRILHIITRLDRGGSATNTLLTASSLAPSIRSSLVFGRTREASELLVQLADKMELVEVRALVRRPSPVRDLLALLRLYWIIRRGRFDLVHTHTSKAGFLGRTAARLAGVPRLVHTPHGDIFTGYSGRTLTTLFILLERWAATFTDRIIGLTDQESHAHLERKIGQPGQYVSIPSGIDIERFRRPLSPTHPSRLSPVQEEGWSRGELPGDIEPVSSHTRIIGSVGRLEPVKGHAYLLEAFATVASHFPQLLLVLVGDGPLRTALQGLAARLGIASRVRFLGWREDVPALLHAFDLFAFPSLNEGMGRGLVEAMAAGLPIVAFRAGGIPEVLGEGEAGLLVEAGNAAALAHGIARLLRDPGLRSRLRTAAQARADYYSIETMLAKIAALYRKLLEGADEPGGEAGRG